MLLRIATPLLVALAISVGILKFGSIPVLGVFLSLGLAATFCRWPALLLLLWLGVFLYQSTVQPWLGMDSLLGHQVGPILILPMDIPYGFTILYLLVCAINRPRTMSAVLKAQPFLTLFLGLVLASTAWHTPAYGKMAIGEARKYYFFFLFPLLTAFAVKTVGNLRQLTSTINILAICLALFGWALLTTHPSLDRDATGIVGEGSLVTLFAFFAILVIHANGAVVVNKPIDGVMLMLLLSITLLARTRTVFLAAGAGVLLLFALARRKDRFVVGVITASALAALSAGLLIVAAPTSALTLTEPIAAILHPASDADASWRMEGWRQQLGQLSGPEVVLGQGLGSYYRWYFHAEEINVSPHSAYVQLVLKFGLLGLAVYVLMVFEFFRTTLAARSRLPPGSHRALVEIGIVNFGAAQAYMTGYGFCLSVLMFYAIGVTAARVLLRESTQDSQSKYIAAHV